MKKVIACIMLAAAMGCTSGCAAAGEQSGPTLAQAETQPPAEPQNSAQSDQGGAKDIERLGAATDEGFYCLDGYNNNLLLCYIDYSQNKEIVLCNRPECTHSDSSCTAYSLVEQVSMAPAVFAYQDSLLLIQPRAGSNSLPHLSAANLDGTDYRELCSFPANDVLDGRLFAQGDDVYLICEEVTEGKSADPIHKLLCVDRTTGKSEILHEFDPSTATIFIEDAYGEHLILEAIATDGKRSLLSYNVSTKEFSEPVFQSLDTSEIALTADGKSYTVDTIKKEIVQTDLASGAKKEIGYDDLQAEVEGHFTMGPLLFHAFDSWFRLDFINTADSSDAQDTSFLMNFETGEFRKNDLLMPYNGENILILDRRADQLLVQADWYVEESGPAPQVEARYALLTKNDYLNSEPNYQPIEKAF